MIGSADPIRIATPIGVSETGRAIAANQNERLALAGGPLLTARIGRVVRLSKADRAEQSAFADINTLAGILRVRSQTGPLKRAMDIVGAGLALVVFGPLLLLTAVAIRLTSRGPALFKQQRHGIDGSVFKIYKFRTMYADQADESGVRQTAENDPRVTPLGRVLRRTNIDELPQLWNVLIGDMSLVGPRPHPVGMRAGGQQYEDLVLAYPLRHLMKPGITGLAQVKGFRGGTVALKHARMRVACDLAYIANSSFFLDCKILLQTIARELRSGTGN